MNVHTQYTHTYSCMYTHVCMRVAFGPTRYSLLPNQPSRCFVLGGSWPPLMFRICSRFTTVIMSWPHPLDNHFFRGQANPHR